MLVLFQPQFKMIQISMFIYNPTYNKYQKHLTKKHPVLASNNHCALNIFIKKCFSGNSRLLTDSMNFSKIPKKGNIFIDNIKYYTLILEFELKVTG